MSKQCLCLKGLRLPNLFENCCLTVLHSGPQEPGARKGGQIFFRSVNPIPTQGEGTSFTHKIISNTSRIFRPSYGPVEYRSICCQLITNQIFWNWVMYDIDIQSLHTVQLFLSGGYKKSLFICPNSNPVLTYLTMYGPTSDLNLYYYTVI